MMYQNIYDCICQNKKNKIYNLLYVKPTAQLLFKSPVDLKKWTNIQEASG